MAFSDAMVFRRVPAAGFFSWFRIQDRYGEEDRNTKGGQT
jgi:hypothetical protein